MRTGMRRVAAAIVTVSLVLMSVPLPASATDLAIGHCASTYNATPYSTYVSTRMCDSDDQTQYIVNDSANQTCAGKVDLGTAGTVHSVRVVVGTGTGYTAPAVYAHTSNFNANCTGNEMDVKVHSYDWTSDTSSTCAGNACHIYTYTFGSDQTFRYWAVAYDGGSIGFQLFSFELTEGDAPADFEDYVAGLHIDHPPFARVIGWEWIKTFAGSWEIRDSDDTLLAGEAGPAGATAGTFESVSIPCTPICGADTYTIEVCEIAHVCATYEIDGDDSGYLIAPAGKATFTYVAACYNASTNQCTSVTPEGGTTTWADAASGSMQVRFVYECNNASQLNPTCAGGSIYVAKAETDDFACSTQNPLIGPITGTVAGTLYEQEYTSWGTAGSMSGLVYWQSATDPDAHACRLFGPVSASGGVSSTRLTPQAQTPDCDIYNLPCQIGIAIGEAFGHADDVWSDAVAAVHDAAAAKLPFAYIVLALDGVNTQLTRASLEVESSSTCSGVTLSLPTTPPIAYTPMGGSPTTRPSWPSGVPAPSFVVLSCAQLEPTMGTTWYQTIRTMMDPAIWLLFAWAELKALQPKTSLTG